MNKPLLIDIHAHLDMKEFSLDLDDVIKKCVNTNVKVIICNGIDVESNRKILDFSKKYPIIKIALGIYPSYCLKLIEEGKQKDFDNELKFIEEKIKEKKIIAIGEVGLEYKEIIAISENQKNIMKDCLKKFIILAKKYNIPIILHSRGAESELVDLLEQEGMKNKKVVMHCFSGRKHLIKRVQENGWHFSVPCNIVRSEHFQNMVKEVPLNQLLTETDSPLLGPVVGQRNDPTNVIYTINKIAEIKKMTPEEVANIIYNNYQRMFL